MTWWWKENPMARRHLIALVGAVTAAGLALVPLGVGLTQAARTATVVWEGSVQYVSTCYHSDTTCSYSLGFTVTDWKCLVPSAQPVNFTALRQALASTNVTMEKEEERYSSVYGSAAAQIWIAALVLLVAWLFFTWAFSQVDCAPCTKRRVKGGGAQGAIDWTDVVCVNTGILMTGLLFLFVQWCAYYMMESVVGLINFQQMSIVPAVNPCIVAGRGAWPWTNAPQAVFGDAANQACLDYHCIMPPYENPTWWWLPLTAPPGILVLGLVLISASAAWPCWADDHNDRKFARTCAGYFVLLMFAVWLGVFALTSLVMAWRTTWTMNPQIDLTWSWQTFSAASPLFRIQKAVLVCLMSTLTVASASTSAIRRWCPPRPRPSQPTTTTTSPDEPTSTDTNVTFTESDVAWV